MRKIVIFDGSFKTTPFINTLCKGLASKHNVYILGFNETVKSKIPKVTYVPLGSNQSKIRFITVSLGLALKSGHISFLFSTLKHLIRGNRVLIQKQNLRLALHTIQPEVIHLQWPSVISWFQDILENQKIPVVLSQRGFHSNVRPFVNEENSNYLKTWYPKMAGFHSVSKAISKKGDEIWNSEDKIDHVVYTGVDFEKLPFKKEYIVQTPMHLLSIGRSHWIKGYDDAIRACKLLKEKGIDFTYTIVGAEGDEELQYLIRSYDLRDSVILKGRIPQHEVFAYMNQSSLLLLPSIEEGVPNVVVEAMALGLPVLSTDCGGVNELITTHKNGWLVPTRNPEALARQIELFSTLDEQTVEGIRLAARAKVEEQHAIGKMVENMLQLYDEVIALF